MRRRVSSLSKTCRKLRQDTSPEFSCFTHDGLMREAPAPRFEAWRLIGLRCFLDNYKQWQPPSCWPLTQNVAFVDGKV